ncbi:MAG TPA: peptidoglycan-binding protein [Solirubrobacteraceae bacterium]|nr:peptidoglycan-binding protein [Solirubrobacteraceae bacterium]
MHGRDVRVLQDFLTRAGFRTAVDGQYGRGTARRVRSWERQEQRRVDGRVSRPDAKALRITVESSSAERAPLVAPPTGKAVVGPDGLAVAPADAPPQVQAIIAAGNRIATKPYKYGGGHGKWEDTGYDCSGSMSYAFHGAGMLDEALDSSGFMSWGEPGKGQWVTIYAKGSHAYMIVAGLRFDTSGRANQGTRWQEDMRSSSGYTVRHPAGL